MAIIKKHTRSEDNARRLTPDECITLYHRTRGMKYRPEPVSLERSKKEREEMLRAMMEAQQ